MKRNVKKKVGRRTMLALAVAAAACAADAGSSFGDNRFWVGSDGGNWNTAANWSATSGGSGGAGVPGPFDSVFLSPATAQTINFDGNYTPEGELIGFNLDSASGAAIVFTQAGNALVSESEEIGGSTIGATYVQTAGANTAGDGLTIGGFAGSAGTYNLSAGTDTMRNLILARQLGSSGVYNLSGTGTLTVTGGDPGSGQGVYIGGTASVDSDGIDFMPGGAGELIINGGSMTVSGLLKVFDTPGSALILSGGSLTVESLDLSSNPALLHWSAGSLTVTDGLTFGPGGDFSAPLALASAESLSTGAGTLNFVGGAITGSGLVTGCAMISGYGLLGANVNNAGTLQAKNGNLIVGTAGTTLINSGILQNMVGANLFINAGTVGNTGNITVNASGSVVFDAAISNISGKTVSLHGGALATPTLTNNSGGTVSGFGQITGDLMNDGSIDFFGPMIVDGNLTNNSDGTMLVRNAQTLITGTFTNNGTLTVQAGGSLQGNATLNGPIIGAGTLAVTSGIVRANGGGNESGSFSVSSGATLEFGGGTHQMNAGVSITNSGTVALTGGSLSFAGTYAAGGAISVSGGTLTAPALDAAGVMLTQSGGTITIAGSENQGADGTVTVNQSGGTHTIGSILFLGRAAGELGQYNLSGTGSLSTNDTEVGYNGPGSIIQSGGQHTANTMTLGNNSGSSGQYTLTAGTLMVGTENVGVDGPGTFTQSGGTHTVAGQMMVALGAARGSYTLSQTGSLVVNGVESIGETGIGSFAQSGGTNTAGTAESTGSVLSVGVEPGSLGSYSLSGGSLTAIGGVEVVGYFGTGSFTQSGGTNNTPILYVALTSGAAGNYTLSGGTLTVAGINVKANGQFHYNGGTLSQTDLGVSGGLAAMSPTADGSRVMDLSALSISSGQVDLGNNKLIVRGGTLGSWNGSNYDGITGLIKSGRNGGGWNGSGIVTSQTAAGMASQLTTLAVATAGSVSKTTFGGQSVASTDVLVMYTYAGDANLSDSITGDDYFNIDQGFASQGTMSPLLGYVNGDFNYDGKINADDYFLIDRNYSAQGMAFSGGPALGGVAAVPEPAVGAMGFLVVLGARRRRRA